MPKLDVFIPDDKIERIIELSYYNHNYYKIISQYPFYESERLNVLYVESEDDAWEATFHLGYFDESGKFVCEIRWEGAWDDLRI